MSMSIDKVIEILDSRKAPETEQDFEDFDTAIETAINLLKTHPDSQPNAPLTLEELREMDGPVWVECGATPFTPNGGYYCLCQFGKITAPSGSQFDIEEIPHWKFYRRKPEEGAA